MSAENAAGYTLSRNASLDRRNTLGVAASTLHLIELHDAAALPQVLALPELLAEPLLVLGQGSNVLLAADWPGTVLSLDTRGIAVEEDAEAVHLAVAAGETWDDLVRWSLAQGWAGLENLVMIPGSVGAAPIQNIGAYGREVASFIEAVEVWDRSRGEIRVLDAAACGFAYRDSVFRRDPDRYIVTAVRLRLPRAAELQVDYAGIGEELRRMGIDRATPFHVADAVVRLRSRKLPDPAVIPNAGSFFKNPVLAADAADRLLGEHPDLPHWAMPHGNVKFSAAWMIESCGFKGLREGDAGMSNRHALVLVNHGAASGAELLAFAQRIIGTVEDRYGVSLEPEPRIILPPDA